MNRFAGKRVLVTGANGGIGYATALRFAQEGASLAVHARRAEKLEPLLNELKKLGTSVAVIEAEIGAHEETQHLVDEAYAALGALDVLVNNAGVMAEHPFLELGFSDWKRVIDTNLTGYFLIGQRAARHMVDAGGGAIVNVSSTRQIQAWPGSTAYTASKGGISMLTRNMALELAPLNVRVNSVSPGTVVTNMNRSYAEDSAFKAKRLQSIPLNRYGEAAEVAATIAFLASDDASFVVGSTIYVDGGQTLW